MNLSVVIVAYKSKPCIENLLLSLKAQTLQPDEIIVIDNSGEDDWQVLENKFKFKCFPQSHNSGYAGGCNIGFSKSKGNFVVFLNPDLKLEKNVLETLFENINKNPKIGALSCFINNESEGKEKLGGTLNPFLTTIPNWFHNPTMTFYPSGAIFITSRKAWISVSGMDSDLFLYGEDVNFGWRLRLAGWQIKKTHNCIVSHQGQASVNKSMHPIKKYFYQERNRILNWKCLNTWHTRFLYMPFSFINEFARLIYSITNINRFLGLLLAWLHILFSQSFLFNKSKEIQSIRNQDDSKIHKWFAPRWMKRKSMFDGFLNWAHNRAIKPLNGLERFAWVILILWLLIGLGLSKIKQGGWPDEIFTHHVTSGNLQNVFNLLANDVHPPGYFLIQWAFSSIAEPFGYMLPIFFAWLSGRVLIRSSRPELKIAAWILWMLPFTLFVGLQLRYYSMVVFLTAWLIRLGGHVKPCNIRKIVGVILAYTTHLGILVVWITAFFCPKKSIKNTRRDAFFSSLFWIPGFFTLLNQAQGRLGNGNDLLDIFVESIAKTVYSKVSFIFGHYYAVNPLFLFFWFLLVPLLFFQGGNIRKAFKKQLNVIIKYILGTFVFCFILTFIINIGVSFVPTRLAFLVVPLAIIFSRFFLEFDLKHRKFFMIWFSVVCLLGYIGTASNKGPLHCGYETPLARLAYEGIEMKDDIFIISERDYYRADFINGYTISNLAELIYTLQAMSDLKPKRYLLIRETNKDDMKSTWAEIESSIERSFEFSKQEGLLYARPESHKLFLDTLDRLTGQKPEQSCWTYSFYEVKK